MNVVIKKILIRILELMLPTLLKELLKALEEVVKLDIDGDGKIGMIYKTEEVKTVKDVVEEITNAKSNEDN